MYHVTRANLITAQGIVNFENILSSSDVVLTRLNKIF